MAFGVNSLMHMGIGALFASQAHIQTTGNNISNVNTAGYSRQVVLQQDRYAIDYAPGQIGQGVETTQVVRHFDKFVESAYLDRATMQSRYSAQYNLMRSIETLYNESNGVPGIGSSLSKFFDAWSKVNQEPDTEAARVALLETARTLASQIRSTDQTLQKMQEEMDTRIREDVAQANSLIQEIAELNREINTHTIANRNNANQLMDLRDEKVRQLSSILDIRVEDRGAGDYTVTTGSGQPLVQQDIPFSLEFLGPRVENNLVYNSQYKGTVAFDGTDGREYTIDVTKAGKVDTTGAVPPPAGTAEYRVSLDGGRTWIMDETTGKPKVFYATDEAHSTKVNKLDISFTDIGNNLSKGDKFVVSPKSDVYWISPTSGPQNISSQTYGDGTENNLRITGGTLGAYLDVRDNKITQYRDRLSELAETLTWEVNRIHSQGAGLTPMYSAQGTYSVGRTDIPLGSNTSGFHWAERLQSGNVTFAIYDPTTGEPLENPGGGVQGFNIFSPENFDPSRHSLEDVVNAINTGPANAYMRADIVNGKLQITGQQDPVSGQIYGFGVTNDTTGLLAGLGINTFFDGENANGICVREELTSNTNLINAGRINGAAEGNNGDNITAAEIAALAKKLVSIGGKQQTITDYYAASVTTVGAHTQSTGFMYSTETAMTNELKARKDEISGVSLDEEMTNLIKFQASYKAAAKLVTTADEMIQTLLSLKS